MATREKEILNERALAGLSHEQLLRFYRTMVTSRRIDDREISLKTQNRIFFQISGAGHEAVGVAVAEHLKSGHDWLFPYYRDRALMLALGQTPLDHLLQSVGAAADPASSGRQMPAHYGDVRYNAPTSSSPTGTQFLQAVGAAEAGTKIASVEGLREQIEKFEHDEIVVVCTGEGATSEGEFWESLNAACILRLPIVYVVQDNGYAISVPIEVQTAGGSISELVRGFPGMHIVECDGTDLIDTYRAAGDAIAYARKRHGPAFIHAHTTRPYSHSMSDDERTYRTPEERVEQDARDPITRARQLLIEVGVASDDELDALGAEVEVAVAAAADEALEAPQPGPETAMRHLYSEDVDPKSSDFDTEDTPPPTRPTSSSRWSTSSTRVCAQRWSGIRGSWCSVKTSPTPRGRTSSTR